MSTASTFFKSHRRLLTWLGGILLGYSLLGFFLLPWLLQSQLEQILDERLDVTSEVEVVYFNPFNFYFEIEQLSLNDPEQDALLNLGNLQLNFQPSRLFLLKLQFAEVRITDLDVYYSRESAENDTISRLARRWSDTAEATTEPAATAAVSGDLIPLEILSLTLSNINTHLRDALPTTPFETTLSLAQAQVDNFSTLPDRTGNNVLSIHFEEGAQLDWNGDFSVSPMQLNGEIALSNFSLLPISRYLQDILPFTLDSGYINLSMNYDIDLSRAEPSIQASGIEISLNDLAATQIGETAEFVEAVSISLTEGQVSMPENRAEFAALSLQNISVSAIRDQTGLINLLAMADALSPDAEPTASEPTAESTSQTASWFFSLAEMSVENSRVRFLDSSLENPFTIETAIDARVTGIDNQAATRFPLTTSIVLGSGGTIALSGELQALPSLEFESTLDLSDIAIGAVQPYVNEFAYLELQSGMLNLDADLNINDDEPFSFRGGVALSDVEISDQQLNETIFSMASLGIDTMSLSVADNNLDISEVSLVDFFARVLINEDGSSNIGRSIKASEESTATDAASATQSSETSPLAITVGRVSLQNAGANFTDLNLPLPFDANIQNLEGSVQGFASNSNQPTAINLEGQVDEFGLVQIVSSLNPFDMSSQSQIDVAFSNIDMPSMTPYIIKFAGREIDEGKVDLDLSYALSEGELIANNQLVLSALRLGERVEQPGAMDLPLDLAIALLKDGNGVIDLEVPITGNVNDPEFDFGPAIGRAISNILTNIVAAPFRLLSNLVGGGDDGSLEQIRFLPGRDDIAAPEQEILVQLSEALIQRPQLLLEIPAISAQADVLALQIAAVDANIESTLEAQPASEDSLTQRRLAAVESLYSAANLPDTLDAIRLLHTAIPETESDDAVVPAQPSASGQLDTLAYIADLREKLIGAESIGEAELAALGSSRRDSVVEFLTTRGGIAEARLLAAEPLDDAEDEDGWLLLPFGLTAQ